MLKQLPKFFLFGYVICSFMLIPVGLAVENTVQTNESINSQMELVQNDVKINDLDIEPINTQQVKKTVIPDTKQEGKKVIGLFLKTMAAVAFCAIILYIILLFVKKYHGSAFVNNEYDEYEALDLSTPNTKQDALKSFLNRTK